MRLDQQSGRPQSLSPRTTPTPQTGLMRRHRSGIGAGLLALALLGQAKLEPILTGLDQSFAVPIEAWVTLPTDSVWRNLLVDFSGNLSFSLSLAAGFGSRSGTQGEAGGASPSGGPSLRYTPIGHWILSVNVPIQLQPDQQASWSGDFSSSFGFNDWHPYRPSLVYGNFGGNRFKKSAHPDNKHTQFMQGTWSLV